MLLKILQTVTSFPHYLPTLFIKPEIIHLRTDPKKYKLMKSIYLKKKKRKKESDINGGNL